MTTTQNLGEPTPLTVPGWHTGPEGSIYVHGGGAIGADGAVAVETRLDGEFGGMDLPTPTRDAAELAEAWRVGMAPLLELPARIVAPLLGVTVWTSLCGPASHITHVIGPPGTGKSFAVRSVLQMFHPQLRYRSEHPQMASAWSSTPIARSRLLARARNTVVFVDDLDDDDASRAAAASAARRTEDDLAPRGSLITTGELASVSAETFCLNVLVADGDLNIEGVQQRVENPRTAAARGLLGASLLCWAAGQLDELKAQVQAWTWGEGSYQEVWTARLRDLPHNTGIRARIADGLATSCAGIRVLHDWLIETGVLNVEQGAALWEWAVAGLDEVARAQDVDSQGQALQLGQLLRLDPRSGAAE